MLHFVQSSARRIRHLRRKLRDVSGEIGEDSKAQQSVGDKYVFRAPYDWIGVIAARPFRLPPRPAKLLESGRITEREPSSRKTYLCYQPNDGRNASVLIDKKKQDSYLHLTPPAFDACIFPE